MSKRGWFVFLVGAAIALILILLGTNPSGSNETASSHNVSAKQVEMLSPSKHSSDVDKAALVTTCELAIKPQLKTPKSLDIDMGQSKVYDYEGMLVLDMFYYAENSYGASAINEVFCEFSYRGTLLNIMHV